MPKTSTKDGSAGRPDAQPPKPDAILSCFPASWRPVVEVIRFHKPAGLLGVYFPYLIGIFFSSCLTARAPGATALTPTDVAKLVVIFLIDSFLLRSWGCSWNEFADSDLDKLVARCKSRPVARGALSPAGAVVVTMVLVLARIAWLALWFPVQVSYHGLLVTAGALFYPFAKRLTNYPQAVLGFIIGWGIILVDAVVDAASPSSEAGMADHRFAAVLCLYLAQSLWNVTYDTVYAFQDLYDDEKAGVLSMAVKFQHNAKAILFSFGLAMMGLILAAGALSNMTIVYFVGAGIACVNVLVMLAALDVHDPASCRWFFVSGQYYVSGMLSLAVVAEYTRTVLF